MHLTFCFSYTRPNKNISHGSRFQAFPGSAILFSKNRERYPLSATVPGAMARKVH